MGAYHHLWPTHLACPLAQPGNNQVESWAPGLTSGSGLSGEWCPPGMPQSGVCPGLSSWEIRRGWGGEGPSPVGWHSSSELMWARSVRGPLMGPRERACSHSGPTASSVPSPMALAPSGTGGVWGCLTRMWGRAGTCRARRRAQVGLALQPWQPCRSAGTCRDGSLIAATFC